MEAPIWYARKYGCVCRSYTPEEGLVGRTESPLWKDLLFSSCPAPSFLSALLFFAGAGFVTDNLWGSRKFLHVSEWLEIAPWTQKRGFGGRISESSISLRAERFSRASSKTRHQNLNWQRFGKNTLARTDLDRNQHHHHSFGNGI